MVIRPNRRRNRRRSRLHSVTPSSLSACCAPLRETPAPRSHDGSTFAVRLSPSQIPPPLLLQLQSLEQRLEVPLPKALAPPPTNDLKEQRRPVLQGLGEQLQQIPLIIRIHQNSQLLDRLVRSAEHTSEL